MYEYNFSSKQILYVYILKHATLWLAIYVYLTKFYYTHSLNNTLNNMSVFQPNLYVSEFSCERLLVLVKLNFVVRKRDPLMHFKVRLTHENYSEDMFVVLRRVSKVSELQRIIQDKLGVPSKLQILYFRGKILKPKWTLKDCEINYRDVVQVCVKNDNEWIAPKMSPVKPKPEPKLVKAESSYYQVGDLIEVCDSDFGAWWDGRIVDVFQDINSQERKFHFRIHLEWNDPSYTQDYLFEEIRPRSYYVYKKSELKRGMIVLVNYNFDEPSKRGYWYVFEIEKFRRNYIFGTIFVGLPRQNVGKCYIKFIKEIMRIEKPTSLEAKKKHVKEIPRKLLPFYCDVCRDRGDLCFNCGCYECGGKNDEPSIILCDECGDGYHLKCLKPPLLQVPYDSEWFCQECRNTEMRDVLNIPDSESDMHDEYADQNTIFNSLSDGIKCTGTSNMVPVNHFGPIPGVQVGTCWKFRIQVSKAGVHRPIIAGIHGTLKEGAYSIVLSSGYEDDDDNGDEFFYSGCGGRNTSMKKHIGSQCTDQVLTGTNKALALNCNSMFNDKCGAIATNWRAGKPVRVVRSYKAGKYSKYAPKDGNRYDGIYKVVKYFPKRGKSGFIVWIFHLKRDDPSPAPWTEKGQEFPIIYSAGFSETLSKTNSSTKKMRKLKIGRQNATIKQTRMKKHLTYKEKFFGAKPMKKKLKIEPFRLSGEIQRCIKADAANCTAWDECVKSVKIGKIEFLNKVEEYFTCICCHELLFQPVTTVCKHNLCKQCLSRSISLGMYTCPYCRMYIGRKRKLIVNNRLQAALTLIFKGYDKYRD